MRASWSAGRVERTGCAGVAILAALWLGCAAAQDAGPTPPQEARPTLSEEALETRKAIVQTLNQVQRKYGADAVLMEGHLLGLAVGSGSVGEAVVAVTGFEDRDGKRYLGFRVDTGIVYNDRDLRADSRLARAWRDIIEASLRKFHAMTVAADGIAVRLGYTHRDYATEEDLRAHLHDDPGVPEAAVFYLLLPDVNALMAARITGQELIDRSVVLIDGVPAHVVLEIQTPQP